MNETIDVIIPLYNAEKYLREAVGSVMAQTVPCRLIIVDDGSTDGSYLLATNLVSEYAKKGKFITLIHQENKGAASARNAGISIGTGDYIVCLDADNKLPDDYLGKCRKVIRKGYDIAYTDIFFFGATGCAKDHISHMPEQYEELFLRSENFIHAGAMFRRTLYDKYGGFPEELNKLSLEDWALWLKYAKAGAVIGKVPNTFVAYRLDNENCISQEFAKDKEKQRKQREIFQALFGDWWLG